MEGRAPVNRASLEQLLVRFSNLVAEQSMICEIDINPVLASAEELVVVDARIVLQDRTSTAAELPKLAIRPYPSHYESVWLSNGDEFRVRPIRGEDEPALVALHRDLSEQSVY
jgi:acetyltransferase